MADKEIQDMRYERRDTKRKNARLISVLKTAALSAMAFAIVACEKPTPEPPTPPVPPKQTARTFPTATNVDMVRGYVDSVKNNVGGFETYVLNIGNISLNAEQNDKTLPDAIDAAGKLSNLKLNKNGKVYTPGNITDNKIVWDIQGFKRHGMLMMANPTNGAWPYAKDEGDLAEFRMLGYNNMTTVDALEQIVNLTAKDIHNLGYSDSLLTVYPSGNVYLKMNNLSLDVNAEDLRNFYLADVPDSGRIIADRLTFSKIYSGDGAWEYRTGNWTGHYDWASQASGVWPKFVATKEIKFAPITIGGETDKNIADVGNSKKILVSTNMFTKKQMVFVNPRDGLEYEVTYAVDLTKYDFVPHKELNDQMPQDPHGSEVVLAYNIIVNYLNDNGISITGDSSVAFQTLWEMANLPHLKGKVAIERGVR
jgi:hypothetical protein